MLSDHVRNAEFIFYCPGQDPSIQRGMRMDNAWCSMTGRVLLVNLQTALHPEDVVDMWQAWETFHAVPTNSWDATIILLDQTVIASENGPPLSQGKKCRVDHTYTTTIF